MKFSMVLQDDCGGADFDDLMVYRDIYYLSRGAHVVKIPADTYYMLGDNTTASKDSRLRKGLADGKRNTRYITNGVDAGESGLHGVSVH